MSSSLPPLTPLASAITQAEGFGASPNNIPTTAQNPGDLELGDQGYGVMQAAGGNQITVFGSLAQGAAALENQLSKIFNGTSAYYNPNMTLDQFGQVYSGGSTTYGQQLASILNVPSSTTLAQVQNGASSSAPSNPIGIPDQILNYLTGNKSAGQSSVTLARAVVLILGILLFGAGLLGFKQTQTIIQTTTSTVKKGVEVAAL